MGLLTYAERVQPPIGAPSEALIQALEVGDVIVAGVAGETPGHVGRVTHVTRTRLHTTLGKFWRIAPPHSQRWAGCAMGCLNPVQILNVPVA